MMRETTRDRWHGAKCRNIPGPAWDELAEAAITNGDGLATDLCHACPVQQDCLEEALRHEGLQPARDRWSIRGGLTPDEREAEARRREGLESSTALTIAERRGKVAALAEAGLSRSAIAEQLGISRQTVSADRRILRMATA